MNRINSLIITAFIAVLSVSCGSGSGGTAALLDDVEGYMQQHPDSALTALTSIPQESLRSDRLRARWSLLYAMALDKNWIDTTDVEVVMPAVKYYDRHKPLKNRAKPHYYLGRIQFNARDYEHAIISFYQAKNYAVDLEDIRFKSLIFQALADTYSCTYLHEEAVAWSDSSYRYCLLARDTMLANSSLFAIAKGYKNLNNYQASDSVFRILLNDGRIYPQVYPRVLSDYGLLLTMYQKDYPLAIEYFEKALELAGTFSHYTHWGAYAYCLENVGRSERSRKIFNRLEATGHANSFSYQRWKSKSCFLEGDYETAYNLLDSCFITQTRNYEILVKQSAVKAQRDYAEELLKESETARKKTTQLYVLSLLLFLSLVSLVILLILRRNDRLRAENENLNSSAESIRMYLSEVQEEHKIVEKQLRQEFIKANQLHFKELGVLYESMLSPRVDKKSYKKLYDKASSLLDSFAEGNSGYDEFEKSVNEKVGGIMSSFRSDCPGLEEKDYRLMCFVISGFDATTISIFSGISSKDAVYMRKSRLKHLIQSSQAKNKERYLEFF
ncbi:MAG: hypothetical protein J5699_07280 [Bacteroidales bacterium]|nr:hypothetical protein [Bacteroidales bacterium]